MKLKKGTIPMTLGLLLIAAALGLSFRNVREDRQAQDASQTVVEELVELIPERKPQVTPDIVLSIPDMELPDYVKFPEMEMPAKEVCGNEYIGTLEIPALGLSLPIISQWSYPKFQVAPCRYLGSAYTGDLILAAHNYPSHFGRIKELEPGDEVIFTDMDGNVFRYQMAVQEILDPADAEGMACSGYPLTLFTCTIGGQYRVTVRFERVDNQI